MKYMFVAALASLLAVPARPASIDEPICTDRPGLNSSTCTVPKGHLQFETGLASWSLTRANGVRTDDWAVGASAIKYGLSDTMHVELDVVPYARSRTRSDGTRSTASAFGDLVVKAKRKLGGRGGFSAALVPYVKLPTASHKIGNGMVEGGLVVPMAYAVAGTPFSLATSPEFDAIADADGHGYHSGMAQVVGLGLSASDKLSLGAEIRGAWDWDPSGTTRQATVSGNAAYKLSDDLQIDGQIDLGLTRESPDVAVGGGVSMRF